MNPLADILIGIRFFSRLPVPATRREVALGAAGLARAAAMVPVAGAVIGICPVAALLCASALALPGTVAAALAVAVSVLVTGALHEDALADCADGFGGGSTRERKLAIMRDSRIGAYGTCAIGLSLIVRVAALAALDTRNQALAASVIVAAAALSRTASLAPLVLLPPARPDGSGATTGRAAPASFLVALAIAVAIGLVPLAAGASLGRGVSAAALAVIATLVVTLVARTQIGGQTGDVAGATQQLVEMTVLMTYAAAP